MDLTGGCLCGRLQYHLALPLGPVVNCHCPFCRRVHGAAFTTVAFAPSSAFGWRPSSAEPAIFTTPLGNLRHFCGTCGTPIWNSSPSVDAGVAVVGSLQPELQPAPWAHVNTESKATWFSIDDALPQFLEWPDPQEIRRMCRQHPGSWVPEPLLGPAA